MSESYQVVLADCPWFYNKRNNPQTKFGGGAGAYYPLMTHAQICAVPVSTWVGDNAVLFLWTTGPRLLEAMAVIQAWGFSYATVGFVWVKTNKSCPPPMPSLQSVFPLPPARPFFGIGYYSKSNAELCLLATRGKPPKPETDHVSQIVIAPRQEHSRKPDDVQFRIEAMYPKAKKLELFARRQRSGWTCVGKDIDGKIL